MGGSHVDRLSRLGRRLDRLATYGLPRTYRALLLDERAEVLSLLRVNRRNSNVASWKLRSTLTEMLHRHVLYSRDDPSTIPAALRLLLVAFSTGIISALSMHPSGAALASLDHTRLQVFMGAQFAAGVLVLWYVAALVRHPDHLPLRQVATPSVLIAICLLVQAATNQPLIEADHIYTLACVLTAIGSFGVALAAYGIIREEIARGFLRVNALAAGLMGINVFVWVDREYGVLSVMSAVQVAMICVAVTGTLMLARLPWKRDVPEPKLYGPNDRLPD